MRASCSKSAAVLRQPHAHTPPHRAPRNMPADEESHDDASDKMVWCGCERGTATGAARDQALWRVALAELCGTALLVLLSCLPGCGPAGADTPMHRALAAGMVVTGLVQSVDHISGAFFNPTVLLAAVLWGRVPLRRAPALLAAQLLGAAAGAGALRYVQAAGAAACVTLPAAGLAAHKAALLEAALGGVLALANCGTWDARTTHLRDSWPLRIGITVAGLSLAGGELTGSSMNPARSFGPALCSGNWAHHWVYWAGPLGGSLVCTLGYLAAWRPRAPRKAPQQPR